MHINITSSVCPSVRPLQIVSKQKVINTEANLMKLYRKIEHNEKVCRAQDSGSYALGQGYNQVRGQNCVSAITKKLLKQI